MGARSPIGVLMMKDKEQHWETILRELTMVAQTSPSPAVFEKLADCYEKLDEREEASVLHDLAHIQLKGRMTIALYPT